MATNRFVRYVTRDRVEIVTSYYSFDQVITVKVDPNPSAASLVGIVLPFDEALRLARDCERADRVAGAVA